MTLGDRIVVMRSGKVLQIGTPMEVYDRPATSFVAGFVGTPRMNFVDGRLEGTGCPIHVHILGISIEISKGSARLAAEESRAVRIGIRPEDFEAVAPGDGDLDARVDVAEPLGKDLLLHVLVAAGAANQPVELRVLSTPASGIGPDRMIGLRLRRDRIHLFDPATEKRIPAFES